MDKTKAVLANTSRSVMAKKFKINDGSHTYVETATLLEPGNKSNSNQNEIEEIREVSSQLAQIKKQHDETMKAANQRQEQLDIVRKQIDSLYVQEVQAEGPTAAMKSGLENLNDALDDTRYKIDEEIYVQGQCHHMLTRMKKDFIAAKLQTASQDAAFKNKTAVLDLEQQRQRKIKEEKLQSLAIFQGLMRNIEKEQRDRQERIQELQKCIRNKEESVQKRIDRQRRNQEIAEAAANENKDSSELKMRENLYIQKLWNSFMRKKMEKEMKNSHDIDEAFKAIKTATGVTDVGEMVKKFMSRESTYSQLLGNVSESEKKTEVLKQANDELRNRLQELKMDADEVEGDDGQEAENRFKDEDIVEMRLKIEEQQKQYQQLQDRYKKVNIVNDQVSGWAKRVFTKFAVLTDDAQLSRQPDDMVKIFQAMEQITTSELRSLKEKTDDNRVEPDDAFIDLDFATEDFINKNIRVRPISGVTNKDQTNDGRATDNSRLGGGDDGEEAQDNYNKLAHYELEIQRKAVKQKFEQFQEEQRRKQALEEKKNKK